MKLTLGPDGTVFPREGPVKSGQTWRGYAVRLKKPEVQRTAMCSGNDLQCELRSFGLDACNSGNRLTSEYARDPARDPCWMCFTVRQEQRSSSITSPLSSSAAFHIPELVTSTSEVRLAEVSWMLDLFLLFTHAVEPPTSRARLRTAE